MDEQVLAAMKKWPNVPAAYGWLSLNARGLWRFHHHGDFVADPEGDTIENHQLIQFFNRNYETTDNGAWYIQNGPQKAFVNLPYAPFILFYDNAQQILSTHHGHVVNTVKHWYFSDDGRIFAQTDVGPAMLTDRDAPSFINDAKRLDGSDAVSRELNEHDIEDLVTGASFELCLSTAKVDLIAPCSYLESNKAEEILGFVKQPKA
jgi:hypothetical protein